MVFLSYSSLPCRLDYYRTKAQLKSGEMAVPGDHWPIFLYANYTYDPEEPWKGLFRSRLLVMVSIICLAVVHS